MPKVTLDTRLADITLVDLMEFLAGYIVNAKREEEPEKKRELVYGMAGIASIFNCSISTAQRLKKSGIIDDAIFQQGRTIVCDKDKALRLAKERQ